MVYIRLCGPQVGQDEEIPGQSEGDQEGQPPRVGQRSPQLETEVTTRQLPKRTLPIFYHSVNMHFIDFAFCII